MAAVLPTPSSMPMDLLGLPEDAIICILKKLTSKHLLTVGCVCKSLYQLASSDCLWMNLCNPWDEHVDVKQWRIKLNSAKALFILLHYFQKLVGAWKAKELYPRGGILCIKWGDLCLIASRLWTNPAGDVILRPVFEVIGLQDGPFKIQLLTGDVDFEFPVELVWSSKGEVEFEFQLCESSEASSSANTTDGECADESNSYISNECTKLFQTRHFDLTSIVSSLGPDHSVLGAHDEILDPPANSTHAHQMFLRPVNQQAEIQDQESTRYPDRAIQCLRSMYAFDNKTLGAGIFPSNKRINKSAYTKLKIDEPKPGQELAGLWSGIYGPHGLEIVNVSYTNDEIIATKLLGDPNVPCNEVTFKVNLASVNMDAQMDFQRILGIGDHDAFHISRMYRGHGRIAGNGFHNPKWVPGRLLVQHNGKMAFLWEDVIFVINFCRLHLESLPIDME